MPFCNDLFLSIRGNIRECMTTPLEKKKVLIFGGIVIVIIIIIIIIAVCVNQSGTSAAPKGSDVIRYHPFVIGGNGIPEFIKKNYKNKINNYTDLDALLIDKNQPSVTDLKKGFVSTQVWDLGASNCTTAQFKDAVSQTLDQIDLMHRIIDLNSIFTLVTSSAEIQRVKTNNKIGSILRVDGGYALDGKLSILRMYYKLGVRILAIGGQCDNPWSSSSWTNNTGGLGNFGQNIVKEMNRLGMIIDIAGASEKTQTDIIASAIVEKVPVLLSHSGSYEKVKSPNNVNDTVLQKLKEAKGLLMLSFDKNCARNETNFCNFHEDINFVIEHLNLLRKTLGVNNIGISADFGTESAQFPKYLDNPSKFPLLFDTLLKVKDPKWTEEDLKKLASDNFINLFKTVEQAAISKKIIKPNEEIIDKTLMIADVNNTCYTDEIFAIN